jgi:hypothetical protein
VRGKNKGVDIQSGSAGEKNYGKITGEPKLPI